MGRADYYKSGDWNGICDVCGQKYKASKLRYRWDGLRVCPNDFEYRQPQDFVRGVKDDQSTPYSRPEIPDSFVTNYCAYGTGAVSGSSQAGCAVAGKLGTSDITLSYDFAVAIAGVAIASSAMAGRIYSLNPDY